MGFEHLWELDKARVRRLVQLINQLTKERAELLKVLALDDDNLIINSMEIDRYKDELAKFYPEK